MNYQNSSRFIFFKSTNWLSDCNCCSSSVVVAPSGEIQHLIRAIYAKRFRVHLSASSPAGSGRKQCGEFIMQMASVSGSVQQAATASHDQTCDVALKSSLHEWKDPCRQTHPCTWETLSEQVWPRGFVSSQNTIDTYSWLNKGLPCLDLSSPPVYRPVAPLEKGLPLW